MISVLTSNISRHNKPSLCTTDILRNSVKWHEGGGTAQVLIGYIYDYFLGKKVP